MIVEGDIQNKKKDPRAKQLGASMFMERKTKKSQGEWVTRETGGWRFPYISASWIHYSLFPENSRRLPVSKPLRMIFHPLKKSSSLNSTFQSLNWNISSLGKTFPIISAIISFPSFPNSPSVMKLDTTVLQVIFLHWFFLK